mmetsp:Transcript_1486/g.3265  ORF Transcript_1486/g.3265 Transcript_1486/m.3265 type:complete len:208 (+) Transcript_1486:1167-1790(+)
MSRSRMRAAKPGNSFASTASAKNINASVCRCSVLIARRVFSSFPSNTFSDPVVENVASRVACAAADDECCICTFFNSAASSRPLAAVSVVDFTLPLPPPAIASLAFGLPPRSVSTAAAAAGLSTMTSGTVSNVTIGRPPSALARPRLAPPPPPPTFAAIANACANSSASLVPSVVSGLDSTASSPPPNNVCLDNSRRNARPCDSVSV